MIPGYNLVLKKTRYWKRQTGKRILLYFTLTHLPVFYCLLLVPSEERGFTYEKNRKMKKEKRKKKKTFK